MYLYNLFNFFHSKFKSALIWSVRRLNFKLTICVYLEGDICYFLSIKLVHCRSHGWNIAYNNQSIKRVGLENFKMFR